MLAVPVPHDEEDRLRELNYCALIDTPQEPVFDRITRLAARVFEVPIALVSFVDREQQWFKSHYGIDLNVTERNHSFCTYTILEPRTLVVPDAHLDPRFANSPLVVGPPFFRFYAGTPITTARGYRLGTLCLNDTVPREFGTDKIALLEEFAGMVSDELDRRMDPGRLTPDELETHYRSVFENAIGGLYQSLPGTGGFLHVNPSFAALLGYDSPESLIATLKDPASVYVQPGRRRELVHILDEEGVFTGLESEILRADGTRLWISESARAVRDRHGRTQHYEGSIEDITARRMADDALRRARDELEDRVQERTAELALFNGTLLQQIADRERAEENARRSETKFRALVENAQDLTSIITPEGVILYVTPSAEHLLGYAPDDLIGRDAFEGIVHPDDRETLRAQYAGIVAEGSRYVRSEVRFRHRDGSWRLLESIASCAPQDFPIVSLVVNSRDITDRRRGELEHKTQVRLQTAVAEFGRFALQGPDLPAIFNKAADLIVHALNVGYCTVTELMPGSETLVIRAGRGWREDALGRNVASWRALDPDGNLVDPEPLILNDLRGWPMHSVLPDDARDEAPVCAVSVVIQTGGRSFGTVCALSSTPREFTPRDVTFLQTVADLLATLIQSKRQEDASREAEARYLRIVANVPGIVYQYRLHPDGSVSLPFISDGCRQLYELDPACLRAEATLLAAMIHPDDRAGYQAAGALSAETLQPFEWEGRILPPSGVVRWIAARSRPERRANGDIVWDGVILDVSELKRAQETMREAKEEAEKANRAKSEFLSRMSHELRTPLNAILGFGQLLGLEDLPPMQASSVDQILRSGRHLLDLVNEVLDIARIDAGSMEMMLERVDAGAMLAEAAKFTRPLAEQRRVAFVNEVPVNGNFSVTADRGRLKQALLNLFSNAVKFNRQGGEVRFACESRPGEGVVRLSVTDTGPGLEADDVSRLFTPFQRLNAGDLGIPGTGVGLAVAKSLADGMGGKIGVQSTPGRGSTFFIDMPAAPAAPEAAEVRPSGETRVHPPRVRTILHIDDQPANLSLLERVFETRADVRLLAADDGRTGLDMVRNERPDLILLDLHLPDIPGDEIIRRLHNEPATRDIPIIVLSADATPGQIARLRQLGAREYITKPFNIQKVLRTITALLDEKSSP